VKALHVILSELFGGRDLEESREAYKKYQELAVKCKAWYTSRFTFLLGSCLHAPEPNSPEEVKDEGL
jgi:hypothetical protein